MDKSTWGARSQHAGAPAPIGPQTSAADPAPGTLAKPGRKSPEGRKKGRVSRLKTPVLGLNGITGAESDVGQRGEHLRPRQDVLRTSRGQHLLSGSYVQQVANSIVVRLECGGIGLRGGVQQRGSRFTLAKCRVQVRIRGPHFVF